MRLLLTLPDLRRGGAESMAVAAACELKARGAVDVEVALLSGESAYGDVLTNAGVVTHVLGVRHRYDPTAGWRLARLTSARRIDVVHAHLFPAALAAAAAHPLSGVPMISTEHSVWNRRRQVGALRVLDALVYRQARRILCVSESVRASLLTWLPAMRGTAHVLHNAVAVRPLTARPLVRYDLVLVGNLDRAAKGVDVLLQALVLCTHANIRVGIAGGGRLLPELRALRDRLGLSSAVEILGPVSDVSELLAASRALVLPSRWEGLPMAILEAMERGLPVVATTVGGIPEVVESGVNGILVPPEDPTTLAAAIDRVLGDPVWADGLGRASRRLACDRFSLERHVAALETHYAEIAGEGMRLSSSATSSVTSSAAFS